MRALSCLRPVRALALASRAAALATAVASLLMWAGPASAVDSSDGTCATVVLQVALAPGGPADQSLSGSYCTPLTWAAGAHTIDILSSGATYNRTYWDWPQYPPAYSFADLTLQAGRAVFFYDRLGTGASSHPLSTDLTIESDAYVLHQLVGWARGLGYTVVDSIGHSLGSAIATQEAAVYADVNRVVLTGLLHDVNMGYLGLTAFTYPAYLDPEFAGDGLDPGYLTTIPGDRSVLYGPNADPTVIAYDEAHKDLVSATEVATTLTQVDVLPPLAISDQITVPVLLVDGTADKLLCGGPLNCSDPAAVYSEEAPYYLSAASLTVDMVAGAGHDLALDPSYQTSFDMINQWIQSH